MQTTINVEPAPVYPEAGTSSTYDAYPVMRQIPELVRWVRPAGFAGESRTIRAPFRDEPLADIPLYDEADAREILDRARRAQIRWHRVPISKRRSILIRYHDLILERREEILDLLQIESGKARIHALEEVLDVANNARYYAYRAARYLRPERRRGALPLLTKSVVYRQPVGVVGLIAPWNYPLTMAVSDAIPALLAGNTVVLKPALQTSLTALWAVRLMEEAGLPEHVFQVITGQGGRLGRVLIDGVDYIGFTGSTEVGRIVARQAGERLIASSMELGGKNPLIVLDDADLEKAIDGTVRSCFTNTGQLCVSIERIYVQSGIYEPFVEGLVRRVRSMTVGAAFDNSVEMGSLISRDQLDKVTEHVEEARAGGATVLAGGRARPDLGPYFYEPTLLARTTPDMSVVREETFGPVASIYRFETDEEAIRLANDSPFGLNASIWTRDHARGVRLATQIHCGTVNVNEGYSAAWGSVDAPMGGFKNSGLGRRHGREGFLKYTEAQTVSVQRLFPIGPSKLFPIAAYGRLMTRALALLRHLPGLR